MSSNAASKKMVIDKKPKRLRFLAFHEGRIDYVFLFLLLLIMVVGMISLFSASFANAYKLHGNSFYFISKQVIYGLGGIALMLFVSTINYKMYDRFVWALYGLTIVLLIIALFSEKLNGAHRWIFFAGITFQPSELAKFAVILLLAHLIVTNYDKMDTFKHGVLPPIVFLGPLLVLVLVEPHLSGTILLIGISAVMLFVGGVRYRWFALAFIIGALALYIVVTTGIVSYARDRFEIWQNPYAFPYGDGYQTIQSLNAIGSGGAMGRGIGGSVLKYDVKLPELQNDYIFSIVCEEVGFIGASIIILLFALLVWRGIVIGMNCPDKFGALIAIGLSSQIGIQVIFNILVITNTVPPTGVPLPFFSAGGTSLIMLLAQMGVLLSISRSSGGEEIVEGEK